MVWRCRLRGDMEQLRSVRWLGGLLLTLSFFSVGLAAEVKLPRALYYLVGTKLHEFGVNVCRNNSGGSTDTGSHLQCCPGWLQENEFSRHCLWNVTGLTFEQELGLITNTECYPNGGRTVRPFWEGCDLNLPTIGRICSEGYNTTTLANGTILCIPCPEDRKDFLCAKETFCGHPGKTCRGRGQCHSRQGSCNCEYPWGGLYCDVYCDLRLGRPQSTDDGKCAPCTDNCVGTANFLACANTAPATGTSCICQPGWRPTAKAALFSGKPACVTACTVGKYGTNCIHTCNSTNCERGTCSSSTGCVCDAGYMGINCNVACPSNLYGPDCNQQCHCANGCDPLTGVCRPCQSPNHGNGTVCVPCTSCDQTKNEKCEWTQFECRCFHGFERRNHTCVPCREGWFGPGCSQQCHCRNGGVCHKTQGTCECPPGYIGGKCASRCNTGFYGTRCHKPCPGHCPLGNCDHRTGVCVCPDGLYGDRCERSCPLAWHYIKSAPPTDETDGNQTQLLDPASASAPPSVMPATTSSGPSCVACRCHRQNSRTCNETGGECVCSPGWRVEDGCHKPCLPAQYGEGCLSSCECAHGVCHHVSGLCACADGYHGDRCRKPCLSGFYGAGCNRICPCGAGASGCDHISGNCNCNAGYLKPLCSEKCGPKNFGLNCSQSCTCENDAPCDPVNGTCLCDSAHTGKYCEVEVELPTLGGNLGTLDQSAAGDALMPFILVIGPAGGAVCLILIILIVIVVVATKRRRRRVLQRLPTSEGSAEQEQLTSEDGTSKRLSRAGSLSRVVSDNPGYAATHPQQQPAKSSSRNPSYPSVDVNAYQSRRAYERLGFKQRGSADLSHRDSSCSQSSVSKQSTLPYTDSGSTNHRSNYDILNLPRKDPAPLPLNLRNDSYSVLEKLKDGTMRTVAPKETDLPGTAHVPPQHRVSETFGEAEHLSIASSPSPQVGDEPYQDSVNPMYGEFQPGQTQQPVPVPVPDTEYATPYEEEQERARAKYDSRHSYSQVEPKEKRKSR